MTGPTPGGAHLDDYDVGEPVRYDELLIDDEPFHPPHEAAPMTTTTVTCDACGSQIDPTTGRVRLVVEGGVVPKAWPADPSTGRQALDLCSSCVGRLDRWLADREGAGAFELAAEMH